MKMRKINQLIIKKQQIMNKISLIICLLFAFVKVYSQVCGCNDDTSFNYNNLFNDDDYFSQTRDPYNDENQPIYFPQDQYIFDYKKQPNEQKYDPVEVKKQSQPYTPNKQTFYNKQKQDKQSLIKKTQNLFTYKNKQTDIPKQFYRQQNQDIHIPKKSSPFSSQQKQEYTNVILRKQIQDILLQNKKKQKQTRFYTQKLDHFNTSDQRTYQQKYMIEQKYYNKNNGSILLYIAGQWPLQVPELQYYEFLASNTSALIIALEHRYYGQSMPMGLESLDLQNLIYLSVQQAIQDIKQFIIGIKAQNQFNITNKPWIIVGVSYAGSLAGWFRLTYPKLVLGAVSSSGVFNITQQYQKYDEQVYDSLLKNGKDCVNRVMSQTIEAQSILRKPDQGLILKEILTNKQISDIQFLQTMNSMIGVYVQYSQRNVICKLFQQTEQALFIMLLNKKFDGISIFGVGQAMKNQIYYKSNPNIHKIRAFMYQICNQIGLFKTASPFNKHRISSKLIDIEYYKNRCLEIYGVLPNITKMSKKYGNIGSATNIISVNGVQDPWRWASIQQNNTNVIAFVIDCDQCSHGVLNNEPTEKNYHQILQVRGYIVNIVKSWINDHWQNQHMASNSIQNKNSNKEKILIFLLFVFIIILIPILTICIPSLIRKRNNNQQKPKEERIEEIVNTINSSIQPNIQTQGSSQHIYT